MPFLLHLLLLLLVLPLLLFLLLLLLLHLLPLHSCTIYVSSHSHELHRRHTTTTNPNNPSILLNLIRKSSLLHYHCFLSVAIHNQSCIYAIRRISITAIELRIRDPKTGHLYPDHQTKRKQITATPIHFDFKGNYGVAINWSDGHYADIFPFEILKSIADELSSATTATMH